MKSTENQFFQRFTLLVLFIVALGWGANAQNTALHFDAASDNYLTIPDPGANSSLDFTFGFTYEAWINLDQIDPGIRTLFAKPEPSNAYGVVIDVPADPTNSRIIFHHRNLRDPATNIFNLTTEYNWSTVTANTWYHIAVTYDNAQTKIYLDGVEVANQVNNETLIVDNNPLLLGFSASSGHPWDGMMDEVRFWNVARTLTEIQEDMDNELSGLEPELMLYYNFDDGIPDADNTTLGLITDLSGNNNNASFVDFALTGSEGNFVDGSGNGVTVPKSTVSLGGSMIIPDTLKVQVDPGNAAIGKIFLDNAGLSDINWSSALSDTLGFGNHVTFSKANFASWQLPENQDRITDNVYIARGDNKSIFNARSETTSSNSVSPADTEWFRGDTKSATTFASFHTMHGGNPGSLVGDTATVHLMADDQYHEVVFSSFSGGNTGGGFAYTRTPMYDYITQSEVTGETVVSGNTGILKILFDATNLKPGLNYGKVTLTTDDPSNPTITIVTELEVRGPSSFSLSEPVVGDTLAIADAATMKIFKIFNTGASALTWSTSTSGRHPFMNLVTLDAFSGTIPAGGEATITVTFDAPTFGYYEWPVTFTTNDPSNPNPTMTINMLSSGVPFAVVGAPGVTFDDTFVGYQSTATLDFSNKGTDTLFVYNAAVDQPGVTLTIDSLTILPNTGTQSLELRFAPTVAGTVNGNLTFDTNDPTKLSNSLPFTGMALDPPVIEVSPLSITQALTVNDTVTTQVTISNTGGSDLTWTVATSLPGAPRIAISDPVNVSSSGGPTGGTDDVISPKVTIARSFVGFTDLYNSVEAGGSPPANLESTTIRWSPKPSLQSVDADYSNSLATVRTSLGGSLVGSTISLHLIEENRYFDLEIITYPVGLFQNAFTYNRRELLPGLETSANQGITAAGGSTQFDIEFYGGGLTNGLFDGSYIISSNDPLAPSLELPITVIVAGGEADISTTSTSLAANDTQINQTSDFSLEIINTGNAPLNVSDVTVDNPTFGIGETSFTVPVLESYMLPLTFTPTLAQVYNATLSIVSDDPANSPFDVSLTGIGIATPDFQVASVLIQDTLTVGVTDAKMMSVINNASGDLEWSIAGEVAFEKTDYTNPNTAAAQDRISDFVWLTRGDEKPVYNYLESTNYIRSHTSILFGDGTTFSQPTYNTFDGTFNSGASGQVGNTTSLFMVEEDRYFDLAYSKWTENGDGGGFAYTRRETVPWLELGSLSGTISGIGQTDVTTTFKTNGLAAGDYEFTYDLVTNDPVNPLQTVTFQLHVTGSPDINITFASDSVRFGDIIIGQTATLPVTVNNAGDSTLSVSSIVFDDASFGVDQTSFKVEPGKNVVLNVSFTPTAVTTYKAGFTITSDDPDENSITFGVRGSGIEGPDLNIDVATVNLQVVAGGSGTADIILSNSGQQNLNWNVSSIYVAGGEVFFEQPESIDWTQAQYQDRITDNVWITRSDNGSLFNIVEQSSVGSSTTIGWAENATVLTGTLPTYSSPLSDVFGGGSSMSSIAGNTLSLHLIDEDRYFDVFFNSWISGNGNVGTGGFAYTRNEVAAWLSSSEVSNAIIVGGPDQTLTLTADAADLSAGTYTSNLVIASNGVETKQTVVVNLIVLGAPQIAITQSTLDFGDVIAGTESSLEVEVTNSGNSALSVSDLTIDNPMFSVSTSSLTIEPGKIALIPVTFAPALEQAYTGTMTITNDDGTNPSVAVSLSGAGISPPAASVDMSELTESLFFSNSATQTFTIQNSGSTDLIWTLAADQIATVFVNPNSEAVNFSVESGVVAPASSQAVTVTFNPSGNFTGSFELPLQVVSNDPANSRIDIPLSLSINGIIVNAIANQVENPEFGTSVFDLSTVFTDAQGDVLNFTMTNSDASIVTISENTGMLTVNEVGSAGTSVISITADDGKGTQETFDFNFQVNPYIWDGAAWNTGSIPPSNEEIRFDGDYTLSGSMEASSIVFTSGVLTVEDGATLIVNSEIDSDGGSVILKSGGSLVTYGDVLGTDYQIERTTTFDSNTGRYSIVGSPIQSANFSTLGASSLVYGYDQSELYNVSGNAGADRFKTPGQLSQMTMSVGQGYFSAYTGDVNGMVSFVGVPNTETINVPLAFTDHAPTDETPFEGFHLVANPYPSAINFTSFMTTNSGADINGSIYLWDDFGSNTAQGTNADYLIVNAMGNTDSRGSGETKWDGNIRSSQGFFVKANSATSVEFNNAMRVLTNNDDAGFYRIAEVLSYKLSLKNDHSIKSTVVGYAEDGSIGEDKQYDAHTLSGGSLQFYSMQVDNEDKLGIQGLPINYYEKVKLGFVSDQSGTHTIDLRNSEEVKASVWLFDNYTNQRVDLTSKSYTFSTEAGTFNDRFTMNTGTVTDIRKQIHELKAYSTEGWLHLISDFEIPANSDYRLIDLNGREVLRGNNQIRTHQLDIETTGLSRTVYILQVNSEDHFCTGKVIIK